MFVVSIVIIHAIEVISAKNGANETGRIPAIHIYSIHIIIVSRGNFQKSAAELHARHIMLTICKAVGESVVSDMVFDTFAENVKNTAPVNS